MNRQIFLGDVIEQLKKFPDQSVDSVVTSVPFFGVRDYGVDGQWGLEKDILMYMDRMNLLMAKLWRVLKRTGTVWIEIGDKRIDNSWYGIPELFFINTRKRGWKSVSKPIWYKRNAFPLSSKNMFSPKYTNIYGFAKESKYFFDLDNVLVPVTTYKPFNVRVRDTDKGKFLQKETRHEKSRKQDNTKGLDGKPLEHYKNFNDRYDHEKIKKKGKNPGDFINIDSDVLDITVKSLKDIEHYATFPPELAERLIKVSTPKIICNRCNTPSTGNVLTSKTDSMSSLSQMDQSKWSCSKCGHSKHHAGLILDCFMGSGTVGFVAESLKIDWVGIELKREFAEYAINRIGIGKIL